MRDVNRHRHDRGARVIGAKRLGRPSSKLKSSAETLVTGLSGAGLDRTGVPTPDIALAAPDLTQGRPGGEEQGDHGQKNEQVRDQPHARCDEGDDQADGGGEGRDKRDDAQAHGAVNAIARAGFQPREAVIAERRDQA